MIEELGFSTDKPSLLTETSSFKQKTIDRKTQFINKPYFAKTQPLTQKPHFFSINQVYQLKNLVFWNTQFMKWKEKNKQGKKKKRKKKTQLSTIWFSLLL